MCIEKDSLMFKIQNLMLKTQTMYIHVLHVLVFRTDVMQLKLLY